jgi:DNA-binding SARP family transcriptional activator
VSERAPRPLPAAVDYRILGPLEVLPEHEPNPVDLGRPRQRSLLALLLLHANLPVPLDRVLDLLWGPDVPDRALGDLQVHVSRLRRALEPDRPKRSASRVLVSVAGGYLLRVGPNELDADRFEVLADHGHRQLVAGEPLQARSSLGQALALWRGPALADFAYEAFAEQEAARLEARRTQVHEDGFEAELALGRHAEAVAGLEGMLVGNRLRERLWYLLMLALYRSDRQAEALRSFARARAILGDELGIEPGNALRRLEADILAHAPALDWHPAPEPAGRPSLRLAGPPDDAATALSAGHDPAGPGPAARPSDRARPVGGDQRRGLVGRTAELTTFDLAFTEACAGRGALVLVSGEAGIGKTRLVAEVAAAVSQRGAWAAWGRGTEVEGAPPFWFWTQIIRSLLASGEPDELRRALGPGAADIAKIVPEVAGLAVAPALSWPADPGARRFRLYEGVVTFLARLAARRPLVLVLDDFQWADVSSLELTELLVQRLPDLPILVVVTCRDSEIPVDGPAAFTLGGLARSPVLSRLVLTGLSEPEVGAFVSQVTGQEVSAEMAAMMHARTDGNPFFVAELARGLTGGDQATSLVDVPLGIREVVRRRLSRVPVASRSLLAVASVMGREFDAGVVAEAADIPLVDAIGLLEVATTAGLVLDDDEGGRHRFSHVLVRDAIYDEIVRLRRAHIHGRLGDALVRRDDGSLGAITELARHFHLAAPVIGPDRGASAALRAADAARSALAYEQADTHLGHGLDLVATMPAGVDRDRLELQLQLRLGFLAFHTRAKPFPEVAEAFRRAQTLCGRAGVTVDHLRLLWGQYFTTYMSGRLEDTAAVADQLLELGRCSDDARFLLAGRIARGTSEFFLGNLATAREHLGAAAEIADALDDPTLVGIFNQDPRVGSRNLLALATLLLGDADEADRIVGRQTQLLASSDHLPSQLMGRLSHGWYWLMRRDVDRVFDVSGQTIERAEMLGYQPALAAARMHHGWALAHLGSTRQGAAMLRRNLQVLDGAGLVAARPCFLGLLAEAEHLDGRTEAALATIDAALTEVARRNDRFYLPELHRLRGDILSAWDGDVDAEPADGGEPHTEATAAYARGRQEADFQGAVVFRDRLLAAPLGGHPA